MSHCCRALGADRVARQTPLPAQTIRTMVQMLDPTSVSDLILRAILLAGFTCLFRPNSYQLLKWRHVSFSAELDVDGKLHVEVVIAVPDSKSVAFAAALGGASRSVKLKEFSNRDLCLVRTLVVLSNKMGVLDLSLAEACLQQRFVVKEECMDWFVFPAVSGGVLSPDKTVSWWECSVFIVFPFTPPNSIPFTPPPITPHPPHPPTLAHPSFFPHNAVLLPP